MTKGFNLVVKIIIVILNGDDDDDEEDDDDGGGGGGDVDCNEKKKRKDFYIKHRILSGTIIAHGLSQLWLLILTPSPSHSCTPESILIAHFIDSSPRPGTFAFSFQFARN